MGFLDFLGFFRNVNALIQFQYFKCKTKVVNQVPRIAVKLWQIWGGPDFFPLFRFLRGSKFIFHENFNLDGREFGPPRTPPWLRLWHSLYAKALVIFLQFFHSNYSMQNFNRISTKCSFLISHSFQILMKNLKFQCFS